MHECFVTMESGAVATEMFVMRAEMRAQQRLDTLSHGVSKEATHNIVSGIRSNIERNAS